MKTVYYGVVDAFGKLVFESINERESKQVSLSWDYSYVVKYSK